ncbi:MAG: hypothetical protein Q4P71_06220 [Actinomycetaceae bacterium]|nr:hypothetical protein [Actinomycetaceae bacterium]
MTEVGIALPFSAIEWRELRRAGSPWQRIARGLWFKQTIEAEVWKIRDFVHQKRIEHVVRISGKGSILDGLTAAAIWGLPVQFNPVIELLTGIKTSRRTSIYSGYGRHDVKVVRSSRTLPEHAITFVKGFRILNLEYLCVELLARFPPRISIPLVDAAAKRIVKPSLSDRAGSERSLTELKERLFAILAERKDRRGCRRAARAIDFISVWADSPGESLLRLAVHQAGLPKPCEQMDVIAGGSLYFVDLGFPEHGVVFEFDGRIKYTGADAADVVYREKLREDAIREQYPKFIRFTWSDLQIGTIEEKLARLKYTSFIPDRVSSS